MKTMFSPSGSHCRSFLTPPSTVNCLRSEPSTFMTQISLLATNAILSAPPKASNDGTTVTVGVEGREVSVIVGSISTTGIFVGLLTGADVSVGKGADVEVLTDASVAGEFLPLLKKKNPPARTAIAITGMTTNNALNPFFCGMGCTLAFMVGVAFTCNFVGSPRAASRRALVISTAVEKRWVLSFAIAFWIMASTDSGSWGLVCRMCGTGSVICLIATAMGVSAS